MTSVVISEWYGGFGLSMAAESRLRELGWTGEYARHIARDDPMLVRVIKELGSEQASGGYADLTVVEIPSGVSWHIHEYDGFEEIHETHRTWSSTGVEVDCR